MIFKDNSNGGKQLMQHHYEIHVPNYKFRMAFLSASTLFKTSSRISFRHNYKTSCCSNNTNKPRAISSSNRYWTSLTTQDLPSFSVAWPVTWISSLSGDDDTQRCLVILLCGSLTLSAGGCWILQQQQLAIDQQQIQHLQVQSQQLQDLPLFTLSSSLRTTPDS
ncbi:hypothetical protein Btru_049653 [Bulinus truncatus]|nr:hypothetical protein Btru_049653 [Bulinus truncatus]